MQREEDVADGRIRQAPQLPPPARRTRVGKTQAALRMMREKMAKRRADMSLMQHNVEDLVAELGNGEPEQSGSHSAERVTFMEREQVFEDPEEYF